MIELCLTKLSILVWFYKLRRVLNSVPRAEKEPRLKQYFFQFIALKICHQLIYWNSLVFIFLCVREEIGSRIWKTRKMGKRISTGIQHTIYNTNLYHKFYKYDSTVSPLSCFFFWYSSPNFAYLSFIYGYENINIMVDFIIWNEHFKNYFNNQWKPKWTRHTESLQ